MNSLRYKTSLRLLPIIALLLKASGYYLEILEAPVLGPILATGILIGLIHNIVFFLEKNKDNKSPKYNNIYPT